MSVKIYKPGGTILAEEAGQNTLSFTPGNVDLSISDNDISFVDLGTKEVHLFGAYTNITKADDTVPSSLNDAILYLSGLFHSVPIELNGGVPVNLQDQTTPAVIAYFNKVTNQTDLASGVSLGNYDIVVTSATGIIVGSYIVLFNPTSERFMLAHAVAVVSTTITLDTPLDFSYPSGTFVDVAVTNMNVDGSTTPEVFGLRGGGTPTGVDLDLDVTRIIFSCYTSSAVNLTLFANFAKLVNGLVLRRRDGTFQNIFNVKDNSEIAGIMYDFNVDTASNPAQGIDGFVARLTFASQGKIGVAIRLGVGEDLEILVQDDLETAQAGETIDSFKVIAEGHIVTD